MFGLIGKMRAARGQRDVIMDVLRESTVALPGCLSYIIATDPVDADAIWVTEVWANAASHKASLSLPAVQAAIGSARPLIAGLESSVVTEPVGGVGISG